MQFFNVRLSREGSSEDTPILNSQLSEGAYRNALSSSSSTPSLIAALQDFEIENSVATEHRRGPFNYPYDESAHMESYVEYLALLNHRQAQESSGESSVEVSTTGAIAAQLPSLANTTNSFPFGVMSSVNDENGDRTADDSSRSNGTENNNEISSGSSVQVNDSVDTELSVVGRDEYSPSASDPSSSSERREGARSFALSPVIFSGVSDSRRRSFRVPHLTQLDLDTRGDTDATQGSSSSSQDSVHRSLTSSIHTHTQPLVLPSSTRLKITVLKWNVAAAWKWTAGDETCGICRMPFEACCIECKTPGDECPLALGACKHAFHMHCIVKWTETQNTARPQCPLCRQEWKFAPG